MDHPNRGLADFGCLLVALVPSILFAGFILLLAVAGIDWKTQAAGGNFNLLGLFLALPLTAATAWIGYRRVTGRGYSADEEASFQLESLSNERVIALWSSLASGRTPDVPPERAAALREALLRTAAERGLTLEDPSLP